MTLRVFCAVKGHAFARDAFEAMVRAAGAEPTIVDQPAAARLMNPDDLRDYDAVLLHDMWGLDFRAPAAERPGHLVPDPGFVRGFEGLLAQGKGFVALHHALAGWPGFPGYAEALGGAFLYKPAGPYGDSGYAADMTYEVEAVDAAHPVLDGVPARFTLTDELYRHPLFADDVVPLLRRATPVADDCYHSAMHAVRRMAQGPGWTPPADHGVLGWARQAGASRIVCLQPGDSAATFADANYRLLLGNALRWMIKRND